MSDDLAGQLDDIFNEPRDSVPQFAGSHRPVHQRPRKGKRHGLQPDKPLISANQKRGRSGQRTAQLTNASRLGVNTSGLAKKSSSGGRGWGPERKPRQNLLDGLGAGVGKVKYKRTDNERVDPDENAHLSVDKLSSIELSQSSKMSPEWVEKKTEAEKAVRKPRGPGGRGAQRRSAVCTRRWEQDSDSGRAAAQPVSKKSKIGERCELSWVCGRVCVRA